MSRESYHRLCGNILVQEQRKLVHFRIRATVDLRAIQTEQIVRIVGVFVIVGCRTINLL